MPNIEGQGDVEMEIEEDIESASSGSRPSRSRWGSNKDNNDPTADQGKQGRLRNLAENQDNNPRSLLDMEGK